MALGQARASCERLADAVAALQAAVRREVGEEGGLSGDGTIGRGAGDGGKNVAADNLHGLEQQARLALRESSRRIESVRLLVRTQRQQQPNTSVSLQSLKEAWTCWQIADGTSRAVCRLRLPLLPANVRASIYLVMR